MVLEQRIEELKRLYSDIRSKTLPDGTGLVKIGTAKLPVGCTPPSTDVLLVFPPGQNTPSARYVKDIVKLPNGSTPGFSPTIVEGETWYTFSYNFSWNPRDPMYQYVESLVTRFAKQN